MIIYLVYNKADDSYLHILHGALIYWVPKNRATIFNTQENADWAKEGALERKENTEKHLEVVEIDTDASLKMLVRLQTSLKPRTDSIGAQNEEQFE